MRCRIEPTRIILARRWLGISKTTLARSLDVSVGAVSLWECGERDASLRLSDLAKVLKQPESFFVGPEVPVTDARSVSFRKRHDASRQVREKASAAIDCAAGVLTPTIQSIYGRLPSLNLPSLQGMRPEAAADALRREWNLTDGPLRSVVEQLEAKGVKVYWISESSPSLSAFCKWVDGDPYVVLNSAKRDGCRSRFDACHELAHLVLHRDTDFDNVDPRQLEREADTFTSAFLLPRETFLEDAPRTFDRDHLIALKKVWGVSVQAMVRRLYDLKVFSDWQYEHAFRLMSGWGWRSNPEPQAGHMESSKIHWLLNKELEELDRPPEWFADRAGLAWENVAEMMPVLNLAHMGHSLVSLANEVFDFERQSKSDASLPYDD